VKTWRGRPVISPSDSDNLLTGVWALVSSKYSLFGVQYSSGHPRPDRSRLCRLEIQKPRTIFASLLGGLAEQRAVPHPLPKVRAEQGDRAQNVPGFLPLVTLLTTLTFSAY
jgi:hypothetical protein